jgi:hypothetical protein
MVRLCAAPTEYIAENLRAQLAAAGVHCLLFHNEIPMSPGFNFGADFAYAEVYVSVVDAERARAVLEQLRGTLCSEDQGCETVYAPRINLRGYHWLAFVLLVCWILYDLPLLDRGMSLGRRIKFIHDTGYAADRHTLLAFILFAFSLLVLLTALLHANWTRGAKRTMLSIGAALLELLILPFWLGYELLRWCWHVLLHVVPRTE